VTDITIENAEGRLIAKLILTSTRYRYFCDGELFEVFGDKIEFHEALMELCDNNDNSETAIQAVEFEVVKDLGALSVVAPSPVVLCEGPPSPALKGWQFRTPDGRLVVDESGEPWLLPRLASFLYWQSENLRKQAIQGAIVFQPDSGSLSRWRVDVTGHPDKTCFSK